MTAYAHIKDAWAKKNNVTTVIDFIHSNFWNTFYFLNQTSTKSETTPSSWHAQAKKNKKQCAWKHSSRSSYREW